MTRFIALSFLLLGWGFYEASGGTEFGGAAEAEAAPAVASEAAVLPAPYPQDEPMPVEIVTRASTAFDAPILASIPAPATPALDAPAPDLRAVAGTRVNMRAGPGTQHGVLATLERGTRTQVLEEADGWVRVRAADGRVGWMAARLLTDV